MLPTPPVPVILISPDTVTVPLSVGADKVSPATVVTVAPEAIDVEPSVGAEYPETVPQEVEVPSVVRYLPELPDCAATRSVPLYFRVLPDARLMCSDEVQESVESTQLKVLSVAPLSVIPPPSAVVSVGVAVSPRTMFLSSTTRLVELRFVVVPFTVKLPERVKSVPDTAPVNVAPESAATSAAKQLFLLHQEE
jgi:hypothetical protein